MLAGANDADLIDDLGSGVYPWDCDLRVSAGSVPGWMVALMVATTFCMILTS